MAILFFPLLALFAIVCVMVIIVSMVRGKAATAKRVLKVALTAYAIYGLILLIVSLASNTEIVAIKEDKCFDDWCAAVDSWEKTTFGASGNSGQGATV